MSNEQKSTDAIVHYRNLAISLGAKPEDMVNQFDHDLCANWDEESAGLWDNDQPEVWEEVLALKEELAAARRPLTSPGE